MRRCCGPASSQGKLELERLATAFTEIGMHLETAQTLLKRALLSPKNPLIWNDLGVAYMAAGKTDEARGAFLRACNVSPEYPLPLYNLGRLAIERCHTEQAKSSPSSELIQDFASEAISYLTISLLRDPSLSQAHALLSSAYEAVGERTRASAHMQEASRVNPELYVKPKRTWLQKFSFQTAQQVHSVRTSSPFLASTRREVNSETDR